MRVLKLILFIAVMVLPWLLTSQIYSASAATGNGSGSSPSNIKEFQNALDDAVAGDLIYFSGTFGGQSSNVKYTMTNSGTSGNPIVLEGRKSDWSEIVYSNKYGSLIADADTLNLASFEPKTDIARDGVEIPYFEGFRYGARNSSNNAVSGVGTTTDYVGDGTGISISGNYVTLKNVLIEYYATGVSATGGFVNMQNINTTQTGDYTLANSYDACNPYNTDASGCPPIGGQYSGFGIVHFGNGGSLKNSAVMNAGAEGIRYTSDDSIHQKNLVFDRDSINSVDYPYQTSFINNGLIEDSEVYIHADNRPHGHGFSFKWNTTNTIARRIKCTNNRMEFQYQGVIGNLVEDFEVIGKGIWFSNGASQNIYRNGIVRNATSATGGENWSENGDVGPFNNQFDNVQFIDSDIGIDFARFSTNEVDGVTDFTYSGVTFDNLDFLIYANRANDGTIIENSTIKNVTNLLKPAVSTLYPVDVEFNNVTFEGSNFDIPIDCGGGLDACVGLPTGSRIRVNNAIAILTKKFSKKLKIK